MKPYDLLNTLAHSSKTLKAKVSAYILNEIDASSFLRDGVSVSDDLKFVQARSSSIQVDGNDYFMDAWFYASVPKSVEVGEFYFLEGRFSNLSKHDYSKEVTLFEFKNVKESGYNQWIIMPCKVVSWDKSPVKDAVLMYVLGQWHSSPMTVYMGDEAVVAPVTRMVENEVMVNPLMSALGVSYTFPSVVSRKFYDLTDLQSGYLCEMLSFPVLQVLVENENFISVEGLAREIKGVEGVKSVVYDLRNGSVNPMSVVHKLYKSGLLVESGSRYVLLVTELVDGIPSIVLGSESLI